MPPWYMPDSQMSPLGASEISSPPFGEPSVFISGVGNASTLPVAGSMRPMNWSPKSENQTMPR